MDKKKLISKFISEGFLIAPDFLETIEKEKIENIVLFLETLKQKSEKPLILTNTFFINFLNEKNHSASQALGNKEANQEKLKIKEKKIETKKDITGKLKEKEKEHRKVNSIRILYSYNESSKSVNVENFITYFRNRFLKFRELLSRRRELEKIVSINKVTSQTDEFSVIGMIQEKKTTKKGNFFLVLEDLTGSIRVIVPKNNKELLERAEELTYDEVIGIRGRGNNQFMFANEIVTAEHFYKEKKKGGKGYALFISDLHVGSKNFLEKEFNRFVRWLNLETNGKNKDIAKNCKYLFVLGDLVDGIGVYPGQEKELLIKNLKEQYDEAAYLLSEIRDDIKIIIIPGNHDATRQALPQPVFDETYASSLYKLKNVLTLSNPSYINVGATENFEGYDILLYHGSSLNYFANNIKSLINKGYEKPEWLLKFILRKRHLALPHGSIPYMPLEKDPLLIERIPDVFAVGELHKLSASYYNNVAMIVSSCWQAKTPYQIKMGQEPDICKVPALNLKNNSIKILDFS